MGFSKLSYTLCLLLFSSYLQIILGGGNDPIHHFCSKKKITSNIALSQSNLDKLIASLRGSAPMTGFGKESVGKNSVQVHGLALCRGDVDQKDCNTCVMKAGDQIRKLCNSVTSGIIWYDNCMVKYSDQDFFGKTDLKNHYRRCSHSKEVVVHPSAKVRLFRKLVTDVSQSPNLYAAGDVEQGLSKRGGNFYGMVQCTRDLSPTNCVACLKALNRRYRASCSLRLMVKPRDGGKIFAGSCFLRYGTQPFVRNETNTKDSAAGWIGDDVN